MPGYWLVLLVLQDALLSSVLLAGLFEQQFNILGGYLIIPLKDLAHSYNIKLYIKYQQAASLLSIVQTLE